MTVSSSFKRGDIEQILKKADIFHLSAEARVRLNCLLYYFTHGRNASETACHFGIARATFYNWLKKINLHDLCALENCSKAPKHVPQPITDERTVDLIRRHRMSDPLLGKKKLSKHLRSAHGISLSASTVGRTINRPGFYFADTPAHRAKRDERRLDGWRKAVVLVSTATGASLLADVPFAHALEGSIYELHPTSPDQTGDGVLEGSAFTLQEGGITDTAQPLQGSVFTITIPAAASSSSLSSSSPSATPAGGPATGGGRRTIPVVQLPSSPSSPASPPSPPSTPSPLKFGESLYAVPSPTLTGTAKTGTPAKVTDSKTGSAVPPPTHTDQTGSYREAAPPLPPVVVTPSFAETWLPSVISAAVVLTVLAGLIGRTWLYHVITNGLGWRSLRTVATLSRKSFFVSLMGASLLFALLWNITSASAATTVPLTRWYQGHLLNADGSAVTTAVTIRFSEWKSADFTAADLTATGSINTSATHYVNWQEEHTLTPTSDGSFAVELGSVNALPDLSALPPSTLTSLYLQVDVKVSGAADSTYDLLDSNTSSATTDRTSILSLPFARTADLLDQRDTGTASGSIPVLTTGGALSLDGDLTINADNEASDATLTFGNNLLNETLKFSATLNRFDFSDDVSIGGDLEVTGTMSGAFLQITGTGASPLIKTQGGNIGIGTATPAAQLDVTISIGLNGETIEHWDEVPLDDPYKLKDWFDTTQGAGRISGGRITANADGTVTVLAGSGLVHITEATVQENPLDCSTCGQISDLEYITWTGTSALVLTNNDYNYIYYDYETASVRATTDFNAISFTREFTLGRAYRRDTEVIVRLCGTNLWNFNRRVQLFGEEVYPIVRATGMAISEVGTRGLAVTAGVLWAELVNRFVTDAFSTATGTFSTWHRDGSGGWTETTGQTQLSNTSYDDGDGVLGTLTNGRYGIHFIYVLHDSTVHSVYGQVQNYTQLQAEAAQPPASIPDLLASYATLIGKVIIQKNGANFAEIQSAFEQTFAGAGTVIHNDTSGLQGGVAAEYYHLTSSEYTGTGSGVFVRATSPTFGGSVTLPLGIWNSTGRVGIGTATPETELEVIGTLSGSSIVNSSGGGYVGAAACYLANGTLGHCTSADGSSCGCTAN